MEYSWHLLFNQNKYTTQQIQTLKDKLTHQNQFGGLYFKTLTLQAQTSQLSEYRFDFEVSQVALEENQTNFVKHLYLLMAPQRQQDNQQVQWALSIMQKTLAQLEIELIELEEDVFDVIFW